MAKKLGADEIFKVESRDGKVVAEQIEKKFGLADETIECTGAESSIHTAIYVSSVFLLGIIQVLLNSKSCI